jgi:hypothetical protein
VRSTSRALERSAQKFYDVDPEKLLSPIVFGASGTKHEIRQIGSISGLGRFAALNGCAILYRLALAGKTP